MTRASPPTLGASCPLPIHEREVILLGHGSGGRLSAELIERLILPAFRNPALEALDDQAVLDLDGFGRLAFTTDSFVVTPIFFPGGDIGQLAVNGTINDLAMGGARPIALSLGFILEEGLPMADLERIIASVRSAADRADVPIVTGDTKVVGRGNADRIFINTSGIGLVPSGVELGSTRVQPGDTIILSGTVGDHGVAVLAQRNGLELQGSLSSDTAALHELVSTLLDACPHVHAMRDPTRGGLAASLVEIASRRGLGIDVDEASVPIRDDVRGACELLGLDPWLVANEGKLIAFVPERHAAEALGALTRHPLGLNAARIGTVTTAHPGSVVARTPLGTQRVVDLPLHEPLPRIC
ncbi:MAG TPA: hydrogenase expression/formation protein HypE [Labilithrix sp.]|nr:hydrogenase expression/formation protein HypE [Labilithrix sp.]